MNLLHNFFTKGIFAIRYNLIKFLTMCLSCEIICLCHVSGYIIMHSRNLADKNQ